MMTRSRCSVLLAALLSMSGLVALGACGASPAAPVAGPAASGSSSANGQPAAASSAVPGAPSAALSAAVAVVAAADRSDDDRKLDAGRHPADLLAFFGIGSGMKVGEIAAGGGYTTELLARAVGPTGAVYGENSKGILEKFAEKPWSERLKKPVMKNVIRLDREFDDPFPADLHDLDAVVCVLFYHDTYWLNVDREKMNKAVFRVLKKGGVYGIVDHSAKPGSGVNDVKTLHRVEESAVRADIEKAGFRLRAAASFLRNPDDKRDWNDAPMAAAERRGTSDRFVLAFEKP